MSVVPLQPGNPVCMCRQLQSLALDQSLVVLSRKTIFVYPVSGRGVKIDHKEILGPYGTV